VLSVLRTMFLKLVHHYLGSKPSIRVLMNQLNPLMHLEYIGNLDHTIYIKNILHHIYHIILTHNINNNHNKMHHIGKIGLSSMLQANLGNKDGGYILMGTLNLLLYLCLHILTPNHRQTYINSFLVTLHLHYLMCLNILNNFIM